MFPYKWIVAMVALESIYMMASCDSVQSKNCTLTAFQELALESDSRQKSDPRANLKLIEHYEACKDQLSKALKTEVMLIPDNLRSSLQSAAKQFEIRQGDEGIIKFIADSLSSIAGVELDEILDSPGYEKLYDRSIDEIVAPFRGQLNEQEMIFELIIGLTRSKVWRMKLRRRAKNDALTQEWIWITKLYKSIDDSRDWYRGQVLEYLRKDQSLNFAAPTKRVVGVSVM